MAIKVDKVEEINTAIKEDTVMKLTKTEDELGFSLLNDSHKIFVPKGSNVVIIDAEIFYTNEMTWDKISGEAMDVILAKVGI